MLLVGKPAGLASDAVRRDVEAWSRWQSEIAAILSHARDADGARMGLTTWAERAAEDTDVADAVYRTTLQADMGGQLFVRAIEVPESSTHLVALDSSPRPSFLRMTFAEALDSFLARRLITPEEFRRLSDEARQRAFTVTRISSEALRERIFRLLAADLESGGTYDAFAASVASGETDLGLTPSSPAYVETVYRTNVASAYGAGRYRQLTSAPVIAARPFVQYRTVRDSRVRSSHAALDGMVFRQDDPAWPNYAPPNGFQCYPGETVVSGRILAAIRTRYSGTLLKLTTKSGRRLTVTPNHPLATVHGFVPASGVHEGERVLSYHGHGRLAVVGAVDPQHAPVIPVKDLFGALAERHGALTLRVVADDLHGDAARGDGYVDVVASDRKLLSHIEAESGKHGRNPRLMLADLHLSLERGNGMAPLGRVGPGHPGVGFPCPGALTLDQGAVSLDGAPLEFLRVGPASSLHSPLSQPAGHDAPGDAEAIGKLLLGHPREVLADEVVNVERVSVSHVDLFDVMTDQGWTVADGIVTSNCRCVVVAMATAPRTVTDASTLTVRPDPGFDTPPAVPLSLGTA